MFTTRSFCASREALSRHGPTWQLSLKVLHPISSVESIYNPSGGRNAVILLFHKSVLCGLGKDCGSQPSLTVSRRTTSSRSWARSPGKRTDPPSPFEIATGSPKSKPPIRSKSWRAQERSPWNRIASSHSGAIMRILFNKGFVIVFSTATIRITMNMIVSDTIRLEVVTSHNTISFVPDRRI